MYLLTDWFFVYKLGLVLEGWIPHISVGVEICRLGLALRVGALLELVLFSVGVDKPQDCSLM
jgi:hypothetical protein